MNNSRQVQIDLREPKCPSCDAPLSKKGEVQQEGYILLEMACNECKKKYKETPLKSFDIEE